MKIKIYLKEITVTILDVGKGLLIVALTTRILIEPKILANNGSAELKITPNPQFSMRCVSVVL